MRGRPVFGAISGLLFGLFVALDLILFGLVPLDSVLALVLPVVGLVLGIVVGVTTPLGRGRDATAAPPDPT
jgi:hypothetical protein